MVIDKPITSDVNVPDNSNIDTDFFKSIICNDKPENVKDPGKQLAAAMRFANEFLELFKECDNQHHRKIMMSHICGTLHLARGLQSASKKNDKTDEFF